MFTYSDSNKQFIQFANDTLILTFDKNLEEIKSKIVVIANDLLKCFDENQ